MSGDVYSWGCFSKIFFKNMDSWIRKHWVAKSEVEYQRQNGGGGGREKNRKIEGSILINNHLQFLVW